MRFRHCPDCGALLSARNLGDEVNVPWCDSCSKPWFEIFPACIIALVHDGRGRVLLLHQDYISTRYANLVSGYITPGESAEECARREIREETGLNVDCLELVGTYWFAKKEMLMIGFFAKVSGTDVTLSKEVNSAEWVDAADAPGLVHPEGSVSHTLAELFIRDSSGSRAGDC